MRSRVEGQIWIDRNSPYRLKYFVNNQEFEVSVAQNYKGQLGICKGNVVALDGEILYKAVFPEDIDKVIGIAGQTYSNTPGLDQREYLPILRMDKLELNRSEIEKCFVDFELLELENILKEQEITLVGAPIYWFIGRTYIKNEVYSYYDSSNTASKGRLTFFTPSGFQWLQATIPDSSFNVGYDNLPRMGTVANFVIENTKLIKLVINVNYSRFDSTLEWNWPYLKENDIGKISPSYEGLVNYHEPWLTERYNGDVNITVRHGLFPYNTTSIEDRKIQIVPRCFCDVTSLSIDNDTENSVFSAVENYYGQQENEEASTDRRTEIYIKTNETLRYSVSGKVNYKFNKTLVPQVQE